MITKINFLFDVLLEFWESKRANHYFSMLFLLVFLGTLILSFLQYLGLLKGLPFHLGMFSCIHASFTLLLIIEIIGQVFVIPYSIANSIGKQFEILCLILLRSAFEDFASLDLNQTLYLWQGTLSKMMADGASALFLFLLLGLYYKLQKHRPISGDIAEATEFVQTKKIVAFLILIAIIFGGIYDILHYEEHGIFKQSLNNFFLVLILADLSFMLFAFRYVIHFPDVFRYSAFVLITIFIRLSLAAPVYWNGILAVLTAIYAIGVVSFHNLFIQGRMKAMEENR